MLVSKDMDPILKRIHEIVKGEGENKLLEVCRILKEKVDHYDWVGFYLVDRNKDRELVLGPFCGEATDHTNISFGEGICGQAADTGKLFLIQDVSKETNYLSCSPTVRSEIVLPIFNNEILVGELDIDSHQLEPFNDLDRELLEKVCDMVSGLI